MRKLEIRLFHEKMPTGAHGMVLQDDDAYMIIVNADESPDEQATAFLHEMLHIYNDDFAHVEDDGTQSVEARTHAQLERLIPLVKRD